MIEVAAIISDLPQLSAPELRQAAAIVAGLLAEHEGGQKAAETYRRIAAAIDAHIPRAAA